MSRNGNGYLSAILGVAMLEIIYRPSRGIVVSSPAIASGALAGFLDGLGKGSQSTNFWLTCGPTIAYSCIGGALGVYCSILDIKLKKEMEKETDMKEETSLMSLLGDIETTTATGAIVAGSVGVIGTAVGYGIGYGLGNLMR